MSRPQLLEMTGLPTLLLLAATTVSVGGWPAPHDTINTTQRRMEEAEGTPHPPALHPSSPESSNPLPSIALQSRGETRVGGVEFPAPAKSRSLTPSAQWSAGESAGGTPSGLHQSSTSMHFFQSSSSHQSGPVRRPIRGGEEVGGGDGGDVGRVVKVQERPAIHHSSLPPLSFPDSPPATLPTLTSPKSTLLSIVPTSPAVWTSVSHTLSPEHKGSSTAPTGETTTQVPKKHQKEEATGRKTSKASHEAMVRSMFFHGRTLSIGYVKPLSLKPRSKYKYRKQMMKQKVDSMKQAVTNTRYPQTEALNTSLDIPELPPEEISVTESTPQNLQPEAEASDAKENGNTPSDPQSNGPEEGELASTQLSEKSVQMQEEGKETKNNSEPIVGDSETLGNSQLSHLNTTSVGDQKQTLNQTEEMASAKANEENASTTEDSQQVNLNVLEKELSEKDEVASDLKLAIAILQHRIVPDLQDPINPNDTVRKDPEPESDESPYPLDSKGDQYFLKNSPSPKDQNNKYDIEIFDSNSSSEEEEEDGEAEEVKAMKLHKHVVKNGTILYKNFHDAPESGERESCYRWFVLVLDGNCSVIKQRMTVFVSYLKAALSSKLSVDYNDVFVPSVFCDNTFMVNISLDTIKNPQAEHELRTLAEANTTLLEISEEIFYLEKILTKRSDDDDKDLLKPLVKKPDDVELVIYIAVGCMCVFILLSVVIVALIKVCRPEGDLMDIGKPLPHHSLTRSLDFPIRRPNVIYSHRFSQSLTPGKYSRRLQEEPAMGGGGVGVASLASGGRGPNFRYDTDLPADLSLGGDELYSIASIGEDPYTDRKALVPGAGRGDRRRTTRVPGEDVIIEEDIAEEEEEEDEEEEEEEEGVIMRQRGDDVAEDEVGLVEDLDEEDVEGERHPHHQPEGVRVVSSAGGGSGGRDVLGGSGGHGNLLGGIDNPCYNR